MPGTWWRCRLLSMLAEVLTSALTVSTGRQLTCLSSLRSGRATICPTSSFMSSKASRRRFLLSLAGSPTVPSCALVVSIGRQVSCLSSYILCLLVSLILLGERFGKSTFSFVSSGASVEGSRRRFVPLFTGVSACALVGLTVRQAPCLASCAACSASLSGDLKTVLDETPLLPAEIASRALRKRKPITIFPASITILVRLATVLLLANERFNFLAGRGTRIG
ncbi:hypothetical protein DFH11DRAFT_471584 [Phellopilus nigrolimitatus]|nr:hypothetical protein DFH11DRAFT_471584 [Phellopilus nigrolimitatus]